MARHKVKRNELEYEVEVLQEGEAMKTARGYSWGEKGSCKVYGINDVYPVDFKTFLQSYQRNEAVIEEIKQATGLSDEEIEKIIEGDF